MQGLIERLRSDCVITTVGDVMVDCWLYGSSWRTSREYGKRVDICDIDREVISCGGAANVARHIVSLGAKSKLFGVINNDMWGTEFSLMCKREDILFVPTIDNSRPTTVKTRVINQTLDCDDVCQRFDRESRGPIIGNLQGNLISNINDFKCNKMDVFIVSDYGKGVVTPWIVEQLVKTGKPVIVDLKYHAEGKYDGVRLIKPNNVDITQEQVLELSRVAPVFHTKGKDGIEVWENADLIRDISGWKVLVKDAVGAGDAVIAGVAIAIASGMDLLDSMLIGNLAGAASVMEEGTLHGVTREKMESIL